LLPVFYIKDVKRKTSANFPSSPILHLNLCNFVGGQRAGVMRAISHQGNYKPMQRKKVDLLPTERQQIKADKRMVALPHPLIHCAAREA
jgi:hypothetical protein